MVFASFKDFWSESILYFGILRKFSSKFNSTPNHREFCFGNHSLFSSFSKKTDAARELVTNSEFFKHDWKSFSTECPSSINTAIFIPKSRQKPIRGLNNFVKMYGPDVKPNGNTVKLKYEILPSRFQEKDRYFWWERNISTWW